MNKETRLIALVIWLAVALCGCAELHPASQLRPPGTPEISSLAPTAERVAAARLEERQRMIEKQIKARGIDDAAVLRAIERVPRHEFVPERYLEQAYADHPLPIGYGQTISQPYIVALMTQLLEIKPGDRVLEVGTGSGYQAAILAEITDQVYTVEIIPQLAEVAEQRLRRLGYDGLAIRRADGYFGWEEHAPYDAIIVTAAPDHIPQPLLRQLANGGRLVIPVGPVGSFQTLWLIRKQGEQILSENKGGVIFVPLTGER